MFSPNVVKNATQRFSSRAERYAKYRPGYPPAFLAFLRDACHLQSTHVVADVGSGAGALTEVFLKNGNAVYAIEPNADMRRAAERALRKYDRFRSLAATGERTTLPGHSVDLVAVGRAFHWLEPDQALSEFARILKPGGWVVIISFTRKIASPFMEEYEALLLAYGPERRRMGQRRLELGRFLTEKNGFRIRMIDEERSLGLEALRGLTLSYSTSPEPDDAGALDLLGALDAMFEKHQRGGVVPVGHQITVFYKQRCPPGGR